jgi:hypothetical protein
MMDPPLRVAKDSPLFISLNKSEKGLPWSDRLWRRDIG